MPFTLIYIPLHAVPSHSTPEPSGSSNPMVAVNEGANVSTTLGDVSEVL